MNIKMVVGIVLLLYLVFSLITITPTYSDENIYLNMIKSVRKGLIPYKDFFFAHPPLQLYLFAFLAKSFRVLKTSVLFWNSLILLEIFVLTKKLQDKKTGLFAMLIFLLFPGYLIFGSLTMGTFESLVFVLLAYIYATKKRYSYSILFSSFAIYTRYLSVLALIPLFFWLMIKNKKTFTVLVGVITAYFVFLFAIFGNNYVKDTIVYHLNQNISLFESHHKEQFIMLGSFIMFLLGIDIIKSIAEKNNVSLTVSVYLMVSILLLFLLLRISLFHYYAFLSPAIFILSAMLAKNDKRLVFMIVVVQLLSLIATSSSIQTYRLPSRNIQFFEYLTDITREYNPRDLFGDPSITNYISFVTEIPMKDNMFDTTYKHIIFSGLWIMNDVCKSKNTLIFTNTQFLPYFREKCDKKLIRTIETPVNSSVFILI